MTKEEDIEIDNLLEQINIFVHDCFDLFIMLLAILWVILKIIVRTFISFFKKKKIKKGEG